jgi:hypothetical protein
MKNSVITFLILVLLSFINFVQCSNGISTELHHQNITYHTVDFECEVSKTYPMVHDLITTTLKLVQRSLESYSAVCIFLLNIINENIMHFPYAFLHEINILSISAIKMFIKIQGDTIFMLITLINSFGNEYHVEWIAQEAFMVLLFDIYKAFEIVIAFGNASLMALLWILWHPMLFTWIIVEFAIGYNLFFGNIPGRLYFYATVIGSLATALYPSLKEYNVGMVISCIWLIYTHRVIIVYNLRVLLTRFLMATSLFGITSRIFGIRLLYRMTVPIDISHNQWKRITCSFVRNGYPITVDDLRTEVSHNQIDICAAMMEGFARSSTDKKIELDEDFIVSNKATLMRSAKLCNESIKIPKLEYFNLLNSEKTELFQLALAMNKRLGSLSPAKIITPFVIVSIAEALTNVRKQHQLVIHTK